MDSSRVVVVGLGSAGSALHLPALAGIPSASLVGVFDLSDERMRAVAQRWRVPTFDSFEALLRTAAPDVVVVCTPPDTHAKYCIEALAAGAHVICEKPFVLARADGERVVAAARSANRSVVINHEFREMPIFRALRETIERVGRTELVFAHVWQLMDLPPWGEGGWRGELRHKTLHEGGVHLIDLIMALFGEVPHAVQAAISAGGLRDNGSDAIAVATLHFSRGRLAQVVQNRLSKAPRQYFEVRVDTRTRSYRASFGGRARISAGFFRSVMPHLRVEFGVSGTAWEERGNRRVVLARNGPDPRMTATREVLRLALADFRSGRSPAIDAAYGLAAFDVIDACYRSAAAGIRVVVGERVAGPAEGGPR
jgi:predicted dehydrogenase